MTFRSLLGIAIGSAFFIASWAAWAEEGDQNIAAQIDQEIWIPLVESVRTADFEMHAATYHPSAVVVFTNKDSTISGRQFLANIKPDFEKRQGGPEDTILKFRFNRRIDNEDTAFETGIFAFSTLDENGDWQTAYRTLEALLIRENGKWLMLMEHQDMADEADWNEAGSAGRIE